MLRSNVVVSKKGQLYRNPCVVEICRIGVRGSIVDRVVRARSAASIVRVNRSNVLGTVIELMAMDIAKS